MKRPSPEAVACVYALVAVFTFGHVLSRVLEPNVDAGAAIAVSVLTAAAWPLYWSYRFSAAIQ